VQVLLFEGQMRLEQKETAEGARLLGEAAGLYLELGLPFKALAVLQLLLRRLPPALGRPHALQLAAIYEMMDLPDEAEGARRMGAPDKDS
jgi:hypothetical protein